MVSYTFVPLDDAGLLVYAGWFADAELRRRVEPPTPQWFDYVRHTPGVFAWLVHADQAAVGFVQLDTAANQSASIELVVRPDQRRQGHGRGILRALLRQPATAALKAIEAMIAADNTASLRCLAAAGFTPTSPTPDGDGFLALVYTYPSSPSPTPGAP